MENKMIFTPEDNSFIFEAEGKKLRVSYEEHSGNHESSMAFCKEHGGGDETVENWRLIAKYRDAINKELEKLDKALIEGWYWANELLWRRDNCAFVVCTYRGDVILDNRSYRNNRACGFRISKRIYESYLQHIARKPIRSLLGLPT